MVLLKENDHIVPETKFQIVIGIKSKSHGFSCTAIVHYTNLMAWR